jgi:predicted regulator of Ras-like GTPase activity (Roadblock/LC7/MglB family)
MADSKILKALKKAMASDSGVEALAVVSVDGLPIEALLPEGMEADRVAAMGAALLSLWERAAVELGKGGLDQVLIRAEKGDAMLMSVGEDAVLLALMKEGAKLGLTLITLKRLAADLKKLL